MSTQKLRYHIIESIKLLASDGTVQLAFYPNFVCKGDEIANLLGDWLDLYQQQNKIDEKYAFSPEQLVQIMNIDRDISILKTEDFSDYAILNSPKWQNIREKAQRILFLLKVDYSLPNKRSV